MKNKNKIRIKKGIRIQVLNIILLGMTLVMAGWFVYSNWELQKQYEMLENAQKKYIAYENAAQILQGSIDNMREDVQFFAQTGEKSYMSLYFKEVMSGRRESALEVLNGDQRESALLTQAKTESDRIMKLDYHIIHLVATASMSSSGVAVSKEYREYTLPKDERFLSNDKKWSLGKKLAFNSDYMQLQRSVSSHIKSFSNKALQRRQNEVQNYEKSVAKHISYQYLLIAVFVVCMGLIALEYHVQVVNVLKKYVRRIVGDELLRPKGVKELRYLADAYNENTEKKLEQEKKLKIRADYDALTGVTNRGAFEKIVEAKLMAEEEENKGAFLLVDVDRFKGVNDGYGHDIGDAVLKKIAHALRDKFRGGDIVGRLGGDEFALWLDGLPQENVSYVTERIDEINQELMAPLDGLPPVSISVGISFPDGGENFQNIYKKSDDALYRVKKGGRCSAAVYVEE